MSKGDLIGRTSNDKKWHKKIMTLKEHLNSTPDKLRSEPHLDLAGQR